MFDAYHFHKEATFDTKDSDKVSKQTSYFLQKKGYIQPNVGSHIITGVP